MNNQHRHIRGFRDLSEDEIAAINRVKAAGDELDRLIGDVETIPDVDPRWLSIAKTDLQKGIMSLVRSIARPESF